MRTRSLTRCSPDLSDPLSPTTFVSGREPVHPRKAELLPDNPGLATDVAILKLGGSVIEAHPGYRVVRSPANPLFHWGNFVIVDPPGGDDVEDAQRWVAVFEREFPAAAYVAISLPSQPTGPAWRVAGVPVEVDDVLTVSADRHVPCESALPTGYRVVLLPDHGSADGLWAGVGRLSLAELDEQLPQAANESFARARVVDKRMLTATGQAAFFAVLDSGEQVVANLGIVCCGRTARYQDVVTAAAHRGRGLAGHLLGVAARWAGEQGCQEWVIVAAADSPAGRIYRRAGFAEAFLNVSAYRVEELASSAG